MNFNSQITLPLHNNIQGKVAYAMWLFWGLLFFPLKMTGLIKLCYTPKDFKSFTGPAIIASNHRHPIDPLTIGIAIFPKLTFKLLPLAPYAAPLHRLQRPGQKVAKIIGFIQAVYYLFNVIKIPEAVSFDEKLTPLKNALKNSETVLIFPEGRSYTEDSPRPFKNGVASLHLTTNTQIIPCAIHYYKKGWLRCAVVSFGAPFFVTASTGKNDLIKTAETIRQSVTKQYQKAVRSV